MNLAQKCQIPIIKIAKVTDDLQYRPDLGDTKAVQILENVDALQFPTWDHTYIL